MKIRFIFPNIPGYMEDLKIIAEGEPGNYEGDYRLQTLGIPSVIAITPEDIECTFIDAQMEDVPYDHEADLVAISIYTPNAQQGFIIADKYRDIGVPVVMGGKHPTIMPENAKEHCDSVIIGEAENEVWNAFLDDFIKGGIQNCKPFYHPPKKSFSMKDLKPPRRDVWDKYSKKYSWFMPPLQISKGCYMACDMCTVPASEERPIRIKPIELVKKEIEMIDSDYIYIVDDNLLASNFKKKYLKELVAMLKANNKKVMLSVTPYFLGKRIEILEMFKDVGDEFYYIWNCFSGKFQKDVCALEDHELKNYELSKKIHDFGVSIFGSMFVGYDWHNKDIFERVVEFALNSEFDSCEFTIATPYPGTPMWFQMLEEDRIITRNWDKFNSGNCVFKPKNMTKDELETGWKYCWTEYWKNTKKNHLYEKFGS
ncbi:MAG: cobalamin-dependent protein, partial [Actinomycetia bacterium]|nr:cobalamin-dependent protein [Actinomycetes bacterium]